MVPLKVNFAVMMIDVMLLEILFSDCTFYHYSKTQLSELWLSEHYIIWTLCLSPCHICILYVDEVHLGYANVFTWSPLVQINEIALYIVNCELWLCHSICGLLFSSPPLPSLCIWSRSSWLKYILLQKKKRFCAVATSSTILCLLSCRSCSMLGEFDSTIFVHGVHDLAFCYHWMDMS